MKVWTGLLVAVAAWASLGSGQAAASEALSKKAGCAVCHTTDKKLVGPTYKEIAAKYKKDPNAPAKLAQSVRKGSKGVFGQVPMTPTPPDKISDAELKAMIDWILKM
jgi:cytochrome c